MFAKIPLAGGDECDVVIERHPWASDFADGIASTNI
jgi:hypothetical protein